MSSYNRVILIGNLGHQPELRYTAGNRPVTELRIAVSRTWNDKQGQRQEKTDWFSIEAWDKQAEWAERYLTKGKPILVEGRLSNDEWTDKEGQKRVKTKVVADTIRFVGPRGEGEGSGGGGYQREGGGYNRGGGGGSGDRPAPQRQNDGSSGGGDEYPAGPEDDIPF